MKSKKYLVCIGLTLGVKSSVFALIIDNFGQAGVQDQILEDWNTQLSSLCIKPNAKIQRVISGAGINDTVPGQISFSEPSTKTIKYSSNDNTFNLYNYQTFILNFSPSTQTPATQLYIKIDLLDSSDRTITFMSPVLRNQQFFNLTSIFKQEPGFEPHEIKEILFNFNQNSNDVEFTLNSIEIVPEPFSMLTLGVGIATFIKKDEVLIFIKIKYKFIRFKEEL